MKKLGYIKVTSEKEWKKSECRNLVEVDEVPLRRVQFLWLCVVLASSLLNQQFSNKRQTWKEQWTC